MLSWQLLVRNGWTVARIGPFVIFVSLLDKRSVELRAVLCVSSRLQVEVYLLPKALDEYVTKSHIPLSAESSPSFLGNKQFLEMSRL